MRSKSVYDFAVQLIKDSIAQKNAKLTSFYLKKDSLYRKENAFYLIMELILARDWQNFASRGPLKPTGVQPALSSLRRM